MRSSHLEPGNIDTGAVDTESEPVRARAPETGETVRESTAVMFTPKVALGPPAARPDLAPEPVRRRRLYIPVAAKLVLALVVAGMWLGVSVYLSVPWHDELAADVGVTFAWVVIGLLAFIPGFLVAFLAISAVLDRQPPLTVYSPTTGVSIVIAARNEEAGIADTIRRAAASDYAGPITIVLADNGSTDGTCMVADQVAAELGIHLEVVHESEPGKAHALNAALANISTAYVITVDADTLLHREAVRRLVSRLESAPPDTVAVAGSVLVRNSRDNLLTRMQEWDYYLGITVVKRVQGLYQSTLVAQGAFSLYRTEEIRKVGGWPDAIGEDIVVTWRLLADGGRVYFEPTAIAFTDVPTSVRHFMRQRARWARGMFEGLRTVPPWRQPGGFTKLIAGIDLLIPLLDLAYVGVFLPGLVLCAIGVPIIVGVWTLLVLPLTAFVYGGLRLHQRRKVFAPLDLRVRKNRIGYVAFLLLYQALCSVASVAGYAQELAGTRRRWK